VIHIFFTGVASTANPAAKAQTCVAILMRGFLTRKYAINNETSRRSEVIPCVIQRRSGMLVLLSNRLCSRVQLRKNINS
jgi:hypothetical protein